MRLLFRQPHIYIFGRSGVTIKNTEGKKLFPADTVVLIGEKKKAVVRY